VLHAPRDGKIAEILVTPGQQIDARDLLMRLE
jgi:biotin carboxyl carrier protein